MDGDIIYKLVKKLNTHSHSGDLYLIEYRKDNKDKKYAAKILGDSNEVNILKYLGKSDHVVEFCGTGTINNIKYSFTRFSDKNIPLNKFQLVDNDKIFNTIVNSIIDGVNFLHKKNVAHRDIKPENILININTFNVKFIDFEFSCKKDMSHPKSQKYCGTHRYSSPFLYRLIKSNFDITFDDLCDSDFFSVGVIIYKLVTGTTPFDIYKSKNENRIIEEYENNSDKDKDKIINNKIKKEFYNAYIYKDYKNNLVNFKYEYIDDFLDE